MQEIVYSNIQSKLCCWLLSFDYTPLFDTTGCTVTGFHRDFPSSPYLYWDRGNQCFTNQTDAENTKLSLNASLSAMSRNWGWRSS